jgi:hypothetical protein
MQRLISTLYWYLFEFSYRWYKWKIQRKRKKDFSWLYKDLGESLIEYPYYSPCSVRYPYMLTTKVKD